MAIGAYCGFHLKVSRKEKKMKEKYDFKGVLGFILFVYAEKNKAKEMIRVGLIYICVCVCKHKISQL